MQSCTTIALVCLMINVYTLKQCSHGNVHIFTQMNPAQVDSTIKTLFVFCESQFNLCLFSNIIYICFLSYKAQFFSM